MTSNTYPSLARPGGIIPPAAPFDILRPCLESQIMVDWQAQNLHGRLLDAGCGTGYMAMAFAYYGAGITETLGIDLNVQAVAKAQETATQLLPQHSHTIHFVHMDLRATDEFSALGTFDAAVCNPPFFEKKLGKFQEADHKRMARSESELRLKDLCQAVAHMLKSNGRFIFCHLHRREKYVREVLDQTGFEIETMHNYEKIRTRDGGMLFIEAHRV